MQTWAFPGLVRFGLHNSIRYCLEIHTDIVNYGKSQEGGTQAWENVASWEERKGDEAEEAGGGNCNV